MQQQQQRNMQFLSLQKPLQPASQKTQQRQSPTVQISGGQGQSNAVSLNIKTDQILNQLQTLACNTQAQTENSEKLQQRLQKSEEILEGQKRQNQVLRMENGKIVEQLRLSKCSMEQLEVQVQTLVSNVEEQRASTREIQKKLSVAEAKYEQSKAWKETLENRLDKTKSSIEELCHEHEKRVAELKSEIDTKNTELDEKDILLRQAKEETEKMQKELEDSKLSLNEKINLVSKMEKNVHDFEIQIRSLEIGMDQSKRDADEKQARLEHLESDKCKLSKEIVDLTNILKERTEAFDIDMREHNLRSEDTIRGLHAKISDQETNHREEFEKISEKFKHSEQYAQRLVLEKDNQAKELLSQADEINRYRTMAEDFCRVNECLKLDLVSSTNQIGALQAALIAAGEEKTSGESVIFDLQNILEKNMQGLEDSFHDITRCCNDLISEEIVSKSKVRDLIASQKVEQQESQRKYAELLKKNDGIINKSNILERQLKEAEHKADERIKQNLFEAQKHINLQMISMREEHSSAAASLLAESKSLKDRLAASEQEATRLKNSVDELKKYEEQNDKLRTELLQESCKVEQLSKELDDKAHQLMILEKQNQLLKLSSSTDASISCTQVATHAAPPDQTEVRKTLFLSPVPSKETLPTVTTQRNLNIDQISSKVAASSSQKASLSKNDAFISNTLQVRLGIDTFGNDATEGKSGFQIEPEYDAGSAMKKRALATSSKAKSANKRASKKQTVTVAMVEPATLKKSSLSANGKANDLRGWDDNCAEFDLFGT